MEIVKIYFIEKDFTGYPKAIHKAYYDDEGDLVGCAAPFKVPSTLSKMKKLRCFNSLKEILEYRICKCGKKTCDVNEELYRLVNERINPKD